MCIIKIKRLLIIIAVIFFVFAAVLFVIRPAASFNYANEEYLQILKRYNNMYGNISMIQYLAEEKKALTDKKNNLNMFAELRQEEIFKIINCYLSNSDIYVTKLNFSEAVPISPREQDETEAENSVEAESDDSPKAVVMSVNFEFKSDYESLLRFIDELQGYPADISITDMHTTFSGDGLVFTVMNINFYALA